MQNLIRRLSGIYVFRLAVPGILRPFVGKREIIISTGTTELALAKIAAGAAATQWRQRFIDLGRLLAVRGTDQMDHQEILKVVTGSPALLTAGHVPLPLASSVSGLPIAHLLRAASEGRLSLHVRSGPTVGHLVPEDQLEIVDAFLGPASGRIVPPSRHMPSGAVSHSLEGLLPLLKGDHNDIAVALLRGEPSSELLALQAPGRAGMWFIPDAPIGVTVDRLEVPSSEVEVLRKEMAGFIGPDHISGRRQLSCPLGVNYPGRSEAGNDFNVFGPQRFFRAAGASPCCAARRR